MRQFQIHLTDQEIVDVLDLMETDLAEKINSRERVRTRFILEESLLALKSHAKEGEECRIQFRNGLKGSRFVLTAPGSKIEQDEYAEIGGIRELEDDIDSGLLQSIMLQSFAERLKITYKYKRNIIEVISRRNEYIDLWLAIIAMMIGLIFGLSIRMFGTPELMENVISGFIDPIRNVFLGCLMTVVVPMVFFSMATCTMRFGDMGSFGRIGAKTFFFFLCTSVLAGLVGGSVFTLISPSEFGCFMGMSDGGSIEVEAISIVERIESFFPSNVVGALYDNNVMQVLLMGAFTGACAGTIGEKSATIKELLDAFNDLLSKMVSVVCSFSPLISFCAIASLVLTIGFDAALPLIAVACVVLLGLLSQIGVYSIILGLFAKVRPLVFLKKYLKTAAAVFAIGSSNASMPVNIEFCNKKVGVSPKVSTFVIPFGATINMDASMIEYAVLLLFFAKVFGVELSLQMILTLFVTMILLSMAEPGVAGVGLLTFSALAATAGLPAQAVTLFIILDSFLDMFLTVCNTTGDVVSAIVIAKSENKLDLEKYEAQD